MTKSVKRQRRFPCVYMRGGTSKAVFFHEEDLPADRSTWPEIFLKVQGSPDVKQIDGMGGSISSTSKVAVIAKSERPDADVDYTFFQVGVTSAVVDTNSNCGNISSAVGPYAIDEGMVQITEPVTTVRVFNTNTEKIIEEHVRVQDGQACVYGDAQIPGVPGTGSRIDMYFRDPAGARTGKLFPTGKRREEMTLEDGTRIEVSLVDCSNPVIFVRAADLGLSGTEKRLSGEQLGVIEALRSEAAVRMGLIRRGENAAQVSLTVPKVALIHAPQAYTTLDEQAVEAQQMDLCIRVVSSGQLHKSCPMTVAVATGAAAELSGTITSQMVRAADPDGAQRKAVRLGHASGVMEVMMEMDGERVIMGGVVRTARRIMDGFIYIR